MGAPTQSASACIVGGAGLVSKSRKLRSCCQEGWTVVYKPYTAFLFLLLVAQLAGCIAPCKLGCGWRSFVLLQKTPLCKSVSAGFET